MALRILLVAGGLLTAWMPSTGFTAEISFNRDIRPILSEHCFACHGFDAKQRKADLRLDVAEGAYAERDGNTPLKPGKPLESQLWLRVISENPEEVMPPPSTKKKLTAEQKETLRQWIEQGARYQKHWAFEAPAKPAEPVVNNVTWARNPVDLFILQRLEQAGLTPHPAASRSTLVRRVAFALTGLPPTLAEVAAFEADHTPQAYEHMVDHYLQSPRYGEEMARAWLDVARYADTHGMHLDNERSMWAYRDWVIKSFNDNLPFDQFTIDQLAGDLLPKPTADQLVATGFNRCNVTTSEGGSIEAEFTYRYAVDRTSTMIETWMGLTGGCAVCHDHKFDPISQREFYSLYSFFYSAADPAMDRNATTTDPFYKLFTAESTAALTKAQADEAEARKSLEEMVSQLQYVDPATLQPAPERRSIEEVWLDDLVPLGAKASCTSRNAAVWSTAPEIDPPLGRRALKQVSAANYQDKFESPTQPWRLPEAARIAVWVRLDTLEPPDAIMVELGTAAGVRKAIWGDPQRFSATRMDKHWLGELPTSGNWTRLEIPLEKLELKPGEDIRSLALSQFGGIAWWDGLTVSGEITPATDLRSSLIAWWKDRTGKDTSGLPADLVPVLKEGPDKNPSADLREKLLRFYLAYVARPQTPEIQQRQMAWQTAQTVRASIEEAVPGTFIFKNLDQPREAFVMLRGQYDKPGEKVEPAVPAIFPPLQKSPPDARASRLDLARWLLAPEHPLTARVTVNRIWQQLLGTGLVKTSSDFGSQGEVPSHPELLDWLAVWYRENGWNTKALVKLLVTSATFRQTAQVTPDLLRIDPENRLYARGPRFRLDAEQIRDNVLYVSGLINLQMGGRGINGYQPPNIWEPVGYADSNTRFYLQDHGAALYRRSIYAFLKRTAPPPFMSNFDAPNREQACARRERSNTPLQALQLMNDTQHFEAARALGERLILEGGTTPAERITFAYRVVLSRPPQPAEIEIVQQAILSYLSRFEKAPEAAQRVVTVGESRPNPKLAATELAAYTLLANLILNLDETVNRN